VFLLRIGNVNPQPIDKRRLSIWISPRDLAQLVSIGIDSPGIECEIVYGISGNKRAWYDNANAARLGYRPQDDSEPFAEKVLAKEKPSGDAIAETYQGGAFCTAEEVPLPGVAPKPKRRRRKT
jgi:uronate dehydrogenase